MNPKVEWFLKRPRYQRVLSLLAVIVVVVGLFFYMMYLPLKEQHNRLLAQVSTLDAKLANDRRIAANLPVFKAEYEKMQGLLQDALKELPNNREIPTLLTSIAATAKENGLDVLFFKPGAETTKEFYAEVPVSLKLKGSFNQVAEFFYDIGTLPRIVNLSNVSMGGAKDAGGRLTLDINCLATTFRFLDKGAQPAGNPQ